MVTACAVVLAACSSHRQGEPAEPQQTEQPQLPFPQKSDVTSRLQPRRVSPSPDKSIIALPQVTTSSSSSLGDFKPKVPGRRVAQVSVPGKYVALTFDDGPSGAYTPKILDILNRHGAKATFFVLGENAARHKSILARAAAEGHEIASHTWSHVKLTSKSYDQIASEMERTSAVIREATGRQPRLMRPPYGATNRGVIDFMMDRYGMTSVLWDVDTVDWKHPGTSAVVHRAVDKAHNGSIILLHDIHASTLAAVEQVVTGLQARGFKLVTVSQLIRLARDAAGQPATFAAAPTMANTLSPTDTPPSSQPALPDDPSSPPTSPEQPRQPEDPPEQSQESQPAVAAAAQPPTDPELSRLPDPGRENPAVPTETTENPLDIPEEIPASASPAPKGEIPTEPEQPADAIL